MVRVAIAGGSGGLGRVITEAIAATNKHEVFLLSRDATSTIGSHAVKTLQVDYSSTTKIAEILKSNMIEVVISAIGVLFEDTHQAQFNLIDGAAQAGTVSRFAPSEFGVDYIEAGKHGFPYVLPGLEGYKASQYKVQAVERLRTTKMEYTRFIIGFLMDYYGFPVEPVTVLPLAVVLDVENCKATIPATGNDPVTLTHSQTIGKFVAASLDLPKWPERSWIIGDTITWQEALEIAEQARGKKFDVTYDSLENLQQSTITELPANVPRYKVVPKPLMDGVLSLWSLGFVQGWFNLPLQKGSDEAINDLFPQVEVLGFKEFMKRCWARDQNGSAAKVSARMDRTLTT